MRGICQSLPVSASSVPHNMDVLAALQQSIEENEFETQNLTPLRSALMDVVSSVAKVVQTEVEERKRLIAMMQQSADGAASAMIKNLESKLALASSSSSRTGPSEATYKKELLQLKETVQLNKEEMAVLRETNDELLQRLTRLNVHVSRLEIEMTGLEEKLAENSLVSAAPSPAPTLSSSGPVADNPELQTAISQAAKLSQELDEAKALSESRLIEINSLRDEKLLLLKTGSVLPPPASSSSDSDLLQDPRVKNYIEQNRIAKAECKNLQEQVLALSKDLRDATETFVEAKRKLQEEHKRELEGQILKAEKLTGKLKSMEQDRDRALHSLQLAEARKPDLQHLPHLILVEKSLKEAQEALTKLKTEHETLKTKIATYESPEASAMEISRLQGEITTLQTQVATLKGQVSIKVEQLGGSDKNLSEELIQARAKVEELQAKVEENEATHTAVLENMEMALTELSTTNEKLAEEVSEREKRMQALLKDKVNASAVGTMNKRQSSIESAYGQADKAKMQALESLLSSERSLVSSLRSENDQLAKDASLLQNAVDQAKTLGSQSVIAIDLLKRKLDEMEKKQKEQESLANQAKFEAEQERGLRARLEEDLSAAKRQVTTLRSSSSTALTQSTGVGGDDRLRKDLDLYKTLFNCTLCERKRQVNCVITICGHVFCQTCIDEKCLKSRNRRCPKCKTAFSDSSVKSLYF